MIRFAEALNEKDREHVRAILQSTISLTPKQIDARSRVPEFLRERTYFRDESVTPFKSLPQDAREEVISELIWRVTCHLEGSITQSGPMDAYDLGPGGFKALCFPHEGRDIFCLTSVA